MPDEPRSSHAEGFFRSLADLIPGVVWTARPDGWVDYANRYWIDFTGFTLDQTFGAGWTRALHPDDVERVLAIWTRALSTGDLPGVEYRVRRAADGTYRWFLAQGYALRNSEGAISKWFGMLSDIDDQKQEEKSLARQNALVSLLHRVALASFRTATFEAALQVAIDQVAAHTGWPVGHVYRLDPAGSGRLVPSDLWHLDAHPEFDELVSVTMRTPLPPGTGLPGRALARKEPVWVMDVTRDDNFPRAKTAGGLGVKGAFAFPVVAAKGVVAVLEFFTREPREPDPSLLEALAQIGMQLGQVHDRQAAEARLRDAKAAADSANQAKSEFLARMSHELRTPLNSVLGFAQLLEMAPGSETQRSHVAQILKAGGHLLALINEVLDLARIEAGQIRFDPRPVDLRALLQEAIDLVRVQSGQRGIRIHPPDPASGDPVVQADPQRLRQVLLNLLSNAIKYNREGGSVDLHFAPTSAHRFRLRIRDQGPGVPNERVPKLFLAFERLGAEATTVEGTGLGLVVSRLLAEAMGGALGLERTGSDGSTFFLELPAAPGPAPEAP